MLNFYPRTPCGVRLAVTHESIRAVCISIHVPRAGYDHAERRHRTCRKHFYPRTPCGVRQAGCLSSSCPMPFLSTYPVRGTTCRRSIWDHRQHISIHVPRAGYDDWEIDAHQRRVHFYPRTPCGVRRAGITRRVTRCIFLSTYPVRGTTCADGLSR